MVMLILKNIDVNQIKSNKNLLDFDNFLNIWQNLLFNSKNVKLRCII